MSIVRSPLPISAFGASWVLLASCSGSNADDPGVIVASGGTIVVAQGGATSSGNGGVMSTGGMRVTGGAGLGGSGFGGAGLGGSGLGGTTGGAAQSIGGSSTTGGAAPTGGNSVSLGGAANGGVSTNGGSVQTGGARLTGGTSNNGGSSNGGTTASGGTATGGTPSSGGSASCTDTPRSSESCADAKAWGFCSQTWFTGYCQATCGQCSGGQGGTTSLGGATSTGGAANGGAATGGVATGGAATGGAATGGAATGGAATGGRATGGAATGGAATGGAATGGAATGGRATGGAATGGSSGGTSVPPLTNGKSGRTTRYWDCCKPSCGWKANAQAAGKSSPASSCGKDGASSVGADTQSVCSGGSAYQCNWGAPWQVGANLSYGYAAFNGTNCGKCYQLDFNGTGDNAGAQSLKGKSMIVQAINIGDIGADHFDLLIPGGGVGANNGCYGNDGRPYQWGNVNGGAQSGGFLATCGNNMTCISDMCTAAFGSNASLMAGCQWFVGWFAGANNPGISYAEVACPAEITNKSGLK